MSKNTHTQKMDNFKIFFVSNRKSDCPLMAELQTFLSLQRQKPQEAYLGDETHILSEIKTIWPAERLISISLHIMNCLMETLRDISSLIWLWDSPRVDVEDQIN